jgi:phospholipid transport system transporter-binding protein
MSKSADITFDNDTCLVSGDLNFSNVMTVYAKSLPQLEASAELEFDFAQVTSSDSAGLALIVEWLKFANIHHKSVQFNNLSADILSLARAAGLDGLFSYIGV